MDEKGTEADKSRSAICNEICQAKGWEVRTIVVAFPEIKRNLVKRALFPLLGLRQPKGPALGIERSALPAQSFLATNLHKPIHDLHSCGAKPSPVSETSRVCAGLSQLDVCGRPADIATQHASVI
jgi:hypothetical protein